MKPNRSTRFLTIFVLIVSLQQFVQPVMAISTAYDGLDGEVACTTNGSETGSFLISNNIVIGNSGCQGEVVIPEGVTEIGANAFSGETAITSVNTGNTVTTIRSNAFYGNTGITSLVLGNRISYIEAYAFYEMRSVASLTIPRNVITIGPSAFGQARALISLNIENGVTNIGEYAFYDASSLTSLTIPGSVTSIGDYAFGGLSDLANLIISEGVTSIGNFSFRNANSLTSISIPESVISIGTAAFENSSTSSLASISFSYGLTSIGDYAFIGASNVTSLDLPNSLVSIGSSAFEGMTSLTHLSIPNSVNTIGSYAFYGTALSSFSYCGNMIDGDFWNGSLDPTIKTCALAVPSAPRIKNISLLSPTSVILDFTAPTSDGGSSITSYKAISIPGGISTSVTQSSSGNIVINNLSAGTSYTFRLIASNSEGDSDSSTEVSIITAMTVPNAPESVIAITKGKRSVTLVIKKPVSTGGSPITGYEVKTFPGENYQTYNVTTNPNLNIEILNLKPGETYFFSVNAVNVMGYSTATISNSVTTIPLTVASITSLTFTDDGTGTGGKLAWAGKNIDAFLFTGPENIYPGPYNYGSFTSGWNGRIRNLIPDTSYTVSIFAISEDGVGESKSLTFKTSAPLKTIADSANSTISRSAELAAQLSKVFTWIDENVFLDGEASRLKAMLNKFDGLRSESASSYLKLPSSSVVKVSATSSTPSICKVEGQLTVHASASGTCTIAYTVTGGSKAPATLVKDFIFEGKK